MRLRTTKIPPTTSYHLMVVLAGEIRPGDQIDRGILDWATVTDIVTAGPRCAAAHTEDESLCSGPARAVRIIDLSGDESEGCVHHAAVLLASLDDGYVHPGPDARDGDAIATYKLARTLKPFSFNSTITVRLNSPDQPLRSWQRDDLVEVWRSERSDLVYRIVLTHPDLAKPTVTVRTESIAKFSKSAAEREFRRLATPSRFHPTSGRRLAVMSLPECQRVRVSA